MTIGLFILLQKRQGLVLALKIRPELQRLRRTPEARCGLDLLDAKGMLQNLPS
jgi:hypothetical protein